MIDMLLTLCMLTVSLFRCVLVGTWGFEARMDKEACTYTGWQGRVCVKDVWQDLYDCMRMGHSSARSC